MSYYVQSVYMVQSISIMIFMKLKLLGIHNELVKLSVYYYNSKNKR